MKASLIYTGVNKEDPDWASPIKVHGHLEYLYATLEDLEFIRARTMLANKFDRETTRAVNNCLRDIKFLLRKQYHLYAHYWD